ncbi:MAG: SGNH/GDSL hydrolase family protein [Verrucomicrobiae bacterium]|nr:SGNH/GDSL hydrolase family protein [Verrucomicrobiae bacterium]MCP5539492.1 SGNH/GDSL hydrolase family protein [Akkermansiaceae bacterium]
MRESGIDLFTVVAGGASPYYWLKAYQPLPCAIGYWQKTPANEKRLGYVRAVPKIEDLMDEYEPEIVVIQTGVNLYATLRSKRRPHDENRQEVRGLIEQMCGAIAEREAKSYWILPPHSHENRYPGDLQEELAVIMKEAVKEYNGAVFESRKVTHFDDPYPATDGIHYGPEDSRQWAERVAADFQVYLRINGSYASRVPIRATPIAGLAPPPAETAANPNLPEGNPGLALPPAGEGAEPIKVDLNELVRQGAKVELDLRLVAKSEIKSLVDVPYQNALGVFEYEVVKDRLGNYPFKKIRVAHGIVFHRHHTGAARREIGDTIALRLVPLAKYPSLQTWQTVDDLTPNFDLPLYTPTLDD